MTLYMNKEIPLFSPMAIDIETSDLDPFQGRLLSVAVSDGTDVWVLLDIHGFDKIKPILENSSILKIAHNAKFEYKWFLQHLGITTVNLFDTQLAEDTLFKGLNYPTSLEDTLSRRYGILLKKEVRKTFEKHPGFAIRPITGEQLEYIQNDVLFLNKLMEQQIEELVEVELMPTCNLENACVPATAELEFNGMKLDVDLWYEYLEQFDTLIEKYENKMREILGSEYFISVEYTKGLEEIPTAEINFNSNPHVLAVFNQRYNLNITSTRQDLVLEPMIRKGLIKGEALEFTNALIDRRFWKKRKGYDYPKHINPVTGKVHGEYHQNGADTGRYSMSKPNIQQVPVARHKDEPNLRRLWIADSPDYVIIRADYSQQEPRIMAELCDDEAMIKVCNSQDVYIALAEIVFGKIVDKKSPERQIAKTLFLAESYGAGLERLSESIDKAPEECEVIKQTVGKIFPAFVAFGPKMRRMAKQYGYTITAIGRRRYFDYKRSTPYNEPLNAPIQGTAADMFKLALYKIHTHLTKLKKEGKIDINTRVWHIVHDEIEVHCHKDEVDFIMPIVTGLMEEAGREICPNVLHVAEAEYSYRWDK